MTQTIISALYLGVLSSGSPGTSTRFFFRLTQEHGGKVIEVKSSSDTLEELESPDDGQDDTVNFWEEPLPGHTTLADPSPQMEFGGKLEVKINTLLLQSPAN